MESPYRTPMNGDTHVKDSLKCGDVCPVSGLPILQKPEWVDVDFGREYRVTLRVLGGCILHSRPSGHASRRDTEDALDLTQKVAGEVFGPHRLYVQIEDYAGLRGATLDARKTFIERMRHRRNMTGIVFCNTSSLFKMSVKLAKGLLTLDPQVHLADDLPAAIQQALHILFPQVAPSSIGSPHPDPSDFIPIRGENREDEELPMEWLSAIKTDLDQLLEEKEKAVQALELERAYLVQVFESSQMAMVRESDNKLIHQVNREFTRLFGYTREDVTGRAVDDLLVPPEGRDESEQFRRRVENGEKVSFEAVRRHKDGTLIPVEVLVFPIVLDRRQVGAYAMYRDIRERIRTETALRKSEKKYRDLFQNVFDMLYVHDMEGRFLETNPAFQRLVGRSEGEMLRLNGRDLMPEGNRPLFGDYLRRIRENSVDEGFFKVVTADGSVRVLEFKNSLILDEHDTPVGVRGSARDLSDRLKMEKALRESEERYRSILDTIHEGYYEVDLAGNLTFVNPAMCSMAGYSREDIIGMSYRELTDDEMAAAVYAVFNRVYRTGSSDKGFEWEIVGKDGARRTVDTSVSLLTDSEGRPVGFRGLLRDVTERRMARKEKEALEAQLQHAQRMEAVGTLAGGIAHNFNNLLMGIQGNASLMGMELDSDHPHYGRLKTIEKLVRSGADLTRQLLGYAREGKYEVRPIDLNELVTEMVDTFGTARREIRVHLQLCDSLRSIPADRGQIEQALMNLLVNAADAMPLGGDLFLVTENVTSRKMRNRPYTPKEGDYALLRVRDTGVGMDDETRTKIFEPFFTTKGIGKGTGLGLASVYGIVKAHGGYIDVSSRKGEGTTFEIFLPTIEAPAPGRKEKTTSIIPGRGTILIVDDEPMVLNAAADMLDRLGYSVWKASGGHEALRLFERDHSGIDLVILDLIMPDMSGGEVYDRLIQIDETVKVLLSSGYSIEGKAAEILERGCEDFLQKPFDLKTLSRKVGMLLRGTPQADLFP